MLLQALYFLFAAITIVGGALGYARAGSKVSALAGGISGFLLIMAGLLVPGPIAYTIALLVSAALLTHFGRSYLAKKKPMPALPIIVLSLICIVATAIAWLR
jgi:uncharacterized membrane protein (UPF0136 family)